MAYLRQAVTPEQHGAKGDGSTDDTTAITAALAAAGAGGTVQFTPGKTYKTTSQIAIPAAGMTLIGYGAVITSATDAQYEKFLFDAKTRGAVIGLRFECLYDDEATGLGNGVIQINASTDITVRDCEFNEVAQQGIFLSGACLRINIESNRFYKNFCAIFSDDDGAGNQPIMVRIVGNEIRTGIGGVLTSFSGGIKMSGTGNQLSSARHVISGNIIDTTGEMGIEIQSWVNDTAITGNTVKGTGFGISVSTCTRVSVTGNTAYDISSYGYEASTSTYVALDGNTFRTNAGDQFGVLITAGASNISVNGGTYQGGNCNIRILNSSGVTINGAILGSPVNGACVYGHNSSDFIVSNCIMQIDPSGFSAVWLDATDYPIRGVNIQNNRIMGVNGNCAVMLHSPNGSGINDILIANNNLVGGYFVAGAFNENATKREYSLSRIRCVNNLASPYPSNPFQVGFNVPVRSVSSTITWPYGYFYQDGGLVNIDASAAALGYQLPNSTGIAGYTTTLNKTDGSANPVVISGWAGATIQGNATVALTSQNTRMTFVCDGASNWVVTNSGRS